MKKGPPAALSDWPVVNVINGTIIQLLVGYALKGSSHYQALSIGSFIDGLVKYIEQSIWHVRSISVQSVKTRARCWEPEATLTC